MLTELTISQATGNKLGCSLIGTPLATSLLRQVVATTKV